MSTQKTTIIIEDECSARFRQRLDEVLSRYDTSRIVNIDTGIMTHDVSNTGSMQFKYYAIVIVEGNAQQYDN